MVNESVHFIKGVGGAGQTQVAAAVVVVKVLLLMMIVVSGGGRQVVTSRHGQFPATGATTICCDSSRRGCDRNDRRRR